MKAIVFHEYGSPDVLEFVDIEKPVPKDNEVLIKVHAASVNDWDWSLLRGKPFVNRLLFGLMKPKIEILGLDIAGTVEETGRDVKHFQPSDEVFGDISGCNFGGFAEYVCVPEHVLALKSAKMSFEQAAAVPQAGVLALQGLRDQMQIKQGDKVLINGAGGGAGTFAIQIAKSLGAEVTGVDSTMKLDLIRKLGADHAIDYTQEDFTKNGQRYELILDVAAHHSIFDYKRALMPKGRYIMLGGASSRIIQVMLLGPLISMISSKKMGVLMHKPEPKDLTFLNELFESNKVIPVIDRCYLLSEVAEAFINFGSGKVQGKIVITIANGQDSK